MLLFQPMLMSFILIVFPIDQVITYYYNTTDKINVGTLYLFNLHMMTSFLILITCRPIPFYQMFHAGCFTGGQFRILSGV